VGFRCLLDCPFCGGVIAAVVTMNDDERREILLR